MDIAHPGCKSLEQDYFISKGPLLLNSYYVLYLVFSILSATFRRQKYRQAELQTHTFFFCLNDCYSLVPQPAVSTLTQYFLRMRGRGSHPFIPPLPLDPIFVQQIHHAPNVEAGLAGLCGMWRHNYRGRHTTKNARCTEQINSEKQQYKGEVFVQQYYFTAIIQGWVFYSKYTRELRRA